MRGRRSIWLFGHGRELLGLSLPLGLTSASYLALGITDTWFMGRVGTVEQAGTALGLTLTLTIGSFLWGALSLVESFIGQEFGAARASGDGGALLRCGKTLREGLVLAGAVSLRAIAIAPATPAAARWFGAPPEVAEVAGAYALIRTLGYAVVCFSDVLKGFFRAIGRPALPMVLACAAVAANVPLDQWLVFGGLGVPPLGASGAATATVVLIVCELFVLIWMYHRSPFARRFGRLRGAIEWRAVLRQARVGAPLGAAMFLASVGTALTWALLGRFGAASLSAHAIVTDVLQAAVVPGAAIGVASATLVAHAVGAGEPERARAVLRSATAIAIGSSLLVGAVLLVAGQAIAWLFSRDAAVVEVATGLFLWTAPYPLVHAVGELARGGLRGAGYARWLMVATIAQTFALQLPLTWWLGRGLGQGVGGAWIASMVAIGVTGLVLLGRLLAHDWRGASLSRGPARCGRPESWPLAITGSARARARRGSGCRRGR